MGIKKKLLSLLSVLALMFCVGLFGNTSRVYAYYPTNATVSSGDIKNVCDTIGLSYTDTSLNSRATACNLLLTEKSANIGNIVFYTDGTNLYVILQGGSIGDSFPDLAVYKNSLGNITVRQHNGFVFSGEEITGVTPATNIKKYMLSPANGTYTESTGNIVIYGNISLGDVYVEVSTQLCATWVADAVASWDGSSNDDPAYDWRFLRPYLTLSGWTAPTPTPTPSPSPTLTPVGGGGTDLTNTNNKIDVVNQSVQEVNQSIQDLTEQISGDTQEIIENLTDVPESGDFEEITSGDIINALNLPTYNDPFTSLWGELITGLSTALTCTELEYITINFLGTAYRLNVIEVDYGEEMNEMLEKIMLVLPILAVIIVWRRIYLDIMSGNFMKVADYFSSFDWSQYF